MIRRRATDARLQNYLGSILTSDDRVKEVRIFGFEHCWTVGSDYQKFRRNSWASFAGAAAGA